MQRLKFTVQAPAMMPPPGPGAPVPDNIPVYFGPMSAVPLRPGVPVNIANATVILGTTVGNQYYGCTYTAPPFVIPGVGVMEVE